MTDPTVTINEPTEGVWTPSCSCGWTGEDWEDPDDAQLEGDEHWDDNHWTLP